MIDEPAGGERKTCREPTVDASFRGEPAELSGFHESQDGDVVLLVSLFASFTPTQKAAGRESEPVPGPLVGPFGP